MGVEDGAPLSVRLRGGGELQAVAARVVVEWPGWAAVVARARQGWSAR
jgi:hypothetical protein